MHHAQILSQDEIAIVLADLHRRGRRSPSSRQNLAIFRLSCCCGLRSCEIRGLVLGDLVTETQRPVVAIRKAATKGKAHQRRGRIVPLWWDSGTRDDLAAWKRERLEMGASKSDPLVCSLRAGRHELLSRSVLGRRWSSAIRALGEDRVQQLSIHCGRHSFVTHALNGGRNLKEVQMAVGHASAGMTSEYYHLIEQAGLGDLFPKPPSQTETPK